jgi:hypothetical protein
LVSTLKGRRKRMCAYSNSLLSFSATLGYEGGTYE